MREYTFTIRVIADDARHAENIAEAAAEHVNGSVEGVDSEPDYQEGDR